MKLACTNCQQQLILDDSKVPAGGFKIKCPKCGKLITGQKTAVETSSAAAGAAEPRGPAAEELQAVLLSQSNPGTLQQPASQPAESGTDNGGGSVESTIKREVAAVRKQLLGAITSLLGTPGHHSRHLAKNEEEDDEEFSKKALICEDDQAFVDIISASVRRLGYSLDVARSTSEALKKIGSSAYDLITVDYIFPDDKEGGNKILAKINGQTSQARRETFVVLISANIKSSDANAAFFHGANITVNKEEINNLEHLIREGQRHFREIYRVFNRILEEKASLGH